MRDPDTIINLEGRTPYLPRVHPTHPFYSAKNGFGFVKTKVHDGILPLFNMGYHAQTAHRQALFRRRTYDYTSKKDRFGFYTAKRTRPPLF